jgi:hypothetical protein
MTGLLVRLNLGRSSYKRNLTSAGGEVPTQSASHGVNRRRRTATLQRLRGIAWEAMMVNSYYGIYQAERVKTAPDAG